MTSRVWSASISVQNKTSQSLPLGAMEAMVLCRQTLLSHCGPQTQEKPLLKLLWVQTLTSKAITDLDALMIL